MEELNKPKPQPIAAEEEVETPTPTTKQKNSDDEIDADSEFVVLNINGWECKMASHKYDVAQISNIILQLYAATNIKQSDAPGMVG